MGIFHGRLMSERRSSLQLSINAIVIIVLAMTLLGLGLGFVRKQFASIGGISGDVQSQIKEQILEDLRTGNKKLSATRELKVNRGESQLLGIGVKNVVDDTLEFGIVVNCMREKTAGPEGCEDMVGKVFYDDSMTNSLSPTEANVFTAEFSAPRKTGTYLFEILVNRSVAGEEGQVNEAFEVYDRASMFLKVIG